MALQRSAVRTRLAPPGIKQYAWLVTESAFNRGYEPLLCPMSGSVHQYAVRGFCGNSSVGRARPCQGRGREFESRFPLQNLKVLPQHGPPKRE